MDKNTKKAVAQNISTGIGFGSVLATIISWGLNKSILYAILHGICGWLYIIYYHFYIRQ